MYGVSDNVAANNGELSAQMDFPLIIVKLAYDGINALDMASMMPLMECMLLFGVVHAELKVVNARDGRWKPTGPEQDLMRGAQL